METAEIDNQVSMMEWVRSRMYGSVGIPRPMLGGGPEAGGNMAGIPFPGLLQEFWDTATRLLQKSVERRKTQLWLSSLDTRPWWADKLH